MSRRISPWAIPGLLALAIGGAESAGCTAEEIAIAESPERARAIRIWKERVDRVLDSGLLPIIDTQSTYDGRVMEIDTIRAEMDRLGIALLAFAPKFRGAGTGSEESLALWKQHPSYFVPTTAEGTNEAWYSQDGPFMDHIEKAARNGEYFLMGEFELRHYTPPQKFKLGLAPHHDVYVPPDSPWGRRLFALSAETGLVFQIHHEPEDGLLEPVERMLRENPRAVVIWCHLAQIRFPDKQKRFGPAYVSDLLGGFDNLYFDLAMSAPGSRYQGSGFVHNTFQNPDGKILPAWRDVIERHSTRFVMGTDIGGDRWRMYAQKVSRLRRMLPQLSVETRKRVAFKNAWFLITRRRWDDDAVRGARDG